METIWRIIIEVMFVAMMLVSMLAMLTRWEHGGYGDDGGVDGNHKEEDDDDGDDDGDVAVARRERGLQGFDDDPDWWLHPLLPYAHRAQCRQVHHRQHRHHHQYHPQIYNTSLLLLLLIKG